MSEVVSSTPFQANTVVVVSGGTGTIVELKATLTIAVSIRTKVETTFSFDKRVASTFPEENKDIRILPSATVPQWRRVARLACVAIDESEIVQLCTELNSIMSYVDQLSSVDVEKVEPMTSVIPMQMKMRPDVVTDGGISDAIIANAPAHEDHFFVVPKVVE